MTKETMSVHEAICELKIIGSRIQDALDEATFCAMRQSGDTLIGGRSVDDAQKSMQSSWDKVNDLIARRNALKRAVAQSNAVTTVEYVDTITGEKLTAAQAIDAKNTGLNFKIELLEQLKKQYTDTKRAIEGYNAIRLKTDTESYITKTFGNVSTDPSKVEEARKEYEKLHTLILVDPLGLEQKIQKLEGETYDFVKKINSALVNSNARTEITIEY
jgi:hypothetical protein